MILVTDAGETTSSADFGRGSESGGAIGSLLYTIVIRPVKTRAARNTAGDTPWKHYRIPWVAPCSSPTRKRTGQYFSIASTANCACSIGWGTTPLRECR